jgi:nucleotide-binding universal stress UspA family protein
MIDNILVPLDGSPLAEQALAAAVLIAGRTAARLHIVHVRTLYRQPGDDAVSDPARAYLDEACERVCAEIGESVSFAVLPESEPALLLPAPSPRTVAELIDGYARAHRIDLVVMATHGRSGLSRFWFGSVADALLRTCSLPILVIRPEEGMDPKRWSSRRTFDHVLVPLDGTSFAHAVLAHARTLAGAFDGRLSLLRVLTLPSPALDGVMPAAIVFTPEDAASVQEHAEQDLARAAADVRSAGVRVETATTTAASAANGILDWAERHGVGLIALATHGRTGLDRMLVGSVADKVVRGARCPVLVVRARQREDEAAQAAAEAGEGRRED